MNHPMNQWHILKPKWKEEIVSQKAVFSSIASAWLICARAARVFFCLLPNTNFIIMCIQKVVSDRVYCVKFICILDFIFSSGRRRSHSMVLQNENKIIYEQRK